MIASIHNLTDDNTLCASGEIGFILIKTLESEGDITIGWFTENEMINNPDKFQVIFLLEISQALQTFH